MPGIPYQAVLFSGYDPPGHFFYYVTDWSSIKVGQSADVTKRMKDRQFKSATLVGKIPCDCELRRDGKGRKICEREIRWANAHANSRITGSEWYRPSTHVITSLRWLCTDDRRALAIIDRLERNARGQTA
jgi:hypothetical protein